MEKVGERPIMKKVERMDYLSIKKQSGMQSQVAYI